ncbi:acyl-CoA N-acyltransferase [Aspergillus nidulans var. acristatus]
MSHEITLEPFLITDIREALDVSEVAFAALNRFLYTSALSEKSMDVMVALREGQFKEPHVKAFKAVHTATGKLVGLTRWAVYAEDQVVEKSVEEVVEARLAADIPERRDDVARAIYTSIELGKREFLGIGTIDNNEKGIILRKRVELEAILVHPEYQRKGIAKRLLAWGIEEAKRLGVDLWLEATEEGRPVYERAGFQHLREVKVVCEGVGESPVTFMILPPKSVQKVREDI